LKLVVLPQLLFLLLWRYFVKLHRVLLALFLTFAFMLGTAQFAFSAADDDIDWSKASPAERHQKMWEAKARIMADRQYTSQLAAQQPMVNTQTNFDVKFYDIFIRVNDTTKYLYGRVRIVAAATEPGVNAVQIDFFDNMYVDSIVAASGPLAYTRASNVVTVTLDHAYNTGDPIDFNFYYHGQPTQGGFQAFSFGTRSGKQVISSLSEPYFSKTWWPCKDRNDDKADSFNIAIEVDTLFYCGSNGTLDSVVNHTANSKIFYYRVRYPMANYLFSVAISPYTVWTDWYRYNANKDSMRITNAVYSDLYTYSLPRFGITPNAIKLLAQTYGPYPYLKEKYGHSNFQWNGGMEHQTMTSMTGSSFGFSEAVVVHELSHQWWGDMITCKTWGDIWLNEGFASYSEALYYLNKDGWDSYHSYMSGMEFAGAGTIYISDTSSVNIIFGSIVYDKGAWVVHMLRRVVGETAFQAVIDAWYNSPYKYGSATTSDFQHVAEAASGQQLDWFFNEWIYGTYRPNYAQCWTTEASPSGGYDNYLLLRQTQTTSPQNFIMPMDVWAAYNSGDDTLRFLVDTPRKLIKWHSPEQAQGVSIDPGNWILKYQTYRSWKMAVVTLDSELTVGRQYRPYRDTVRQIGALGPLSVSVTAGALPTGLAIDNSGIISGTTPDTGSFPFTVRFLDNTSAVADTVAFTLHMKPALLYPGDVNLSQSPVIDLADLSYLVAYLTSSTPVPLAMKLADVNADCVVNLADLSVFVSHLTGGGATFVLGCAP
jgi:aminopeptidase N